MRLKTHLSPGSGRIGGFTLIEVALSLAVLAVLLTGILVPLISQVQQRNVSTTEKTLAYIKDALLGFAALNGRLPCPATSASAGAEAFDTGAGGGPTNGKCASFWGYVPARTLGVAPIDPVLGYALDGWGSANNGIRYAVSNDNVGTVPKAFTTADGLRSATLAEAAKITSLLHVCDSGSNVTPINCGTTAKTLTSNAVAVIWSVGANASTGPTGVDEAQNPNPKDETSADRTFVSHPASDTQNNPFDDIMTWVSINTLVNRMVGAGQLP